MEIVEQGLRRRPDSAHLHALLAAIYSENGDRRRAQSELSEAERINPDLEVVQAVHEMLHQSESDSFTRNSTISKSRQAGNA